MLRTVEEHGKHTAACVWKPLRFQQSEVWGGAELGVNPYHCAECPSMDFMDFMEEQNNARWKGALEVIWSGQLLRAEQTSKLV